MLYSHNQLYIYIYIQKYIQHNNDKRTQFFRKIYLSLYSKVRKVYERFYCVRGELETEQDCNILTPTLLAITTSLSCSTVQLNWGLQHGSLLGHGSHSSIFSPTDLNFLSPGLYNQPLDSQGRPWSPDIFDRMHLLFTQVHFFLRQLGRVGGQYATLLSSPL